MIPIFLYLAYVVALLLCVAQLVRLGLRRFRMFPEPAAGSQGVLGNFADQLLVGLITLTTLVSVISLVHAITSNVQIAISLVVFLCGGPLAVKALRKKWRSLAPVRHRPLILVLALFMAWAVFIASGEVRVYDTGTYHVQAIRWIKEYGVAPGLANLFGQLGYNSAWYVFCGFLDHGPFDHGKSYHIAGLLVFVYFLAFCLEGCQRLAAGRNSLSAFLRLFGFIAITYYYRDFVASLGNDMIAAVLLHHALVRTSEVMEDQSLNNAGNNPGERRRLLALVTAVTVFAVTVKFSVFPCLLFPCLIWLYCRGERAALILPCLGMAVCLGLPFVARNYVLSGYVLYPQTQLDFFRCDWKVPADDVRWMTYYIREFAIGRDKDLDLASMSIGAKFLTWLHSWGGERSVQWLLAWVAAGLGNCLLILLFRRKEYSRNFLGRWSMFGVIMIGVAFCAATAPEPRFLGGWGLAVGYFPVAWMANSFANHRFAKATFCSSRVLVIPFVYGMLLCVPVLLKITNLATASFRQSPGITTSPLVQMDSGGSRSADRISVDEQVKHKSLLGILWNVRSLPVVATITERSANGAEARLPAVSNKLWDTPLPATQRLHPWLQMRGPSLKDGFRVTQPAGWICYISTHQHKSNPSAPMQH